MAESLQRRAAIFMELCDERNYSIEQLAGTGLPLKALQHFIEAKAELTSEQLFTALGKLEISMEHYFMRTHENRIKIYEDFCLKHRHYYIEQNVTKLQEIRDEIIQKASNDVELNFSFWIVSSWIQDIDPTMKMENEEEEKEKMKRWLGFVEDWGSDELLLFLSSGRMLGLEFVCECTHTLIRRSSSLCIDLNRQRKVVSAILNTAIFCVEEGGNYLLQGNLFLETAKGLLTEEFSHERIVHMYIEGFIMCRNKRMLEEGKKKMLDAVEIFEKIGSTNVAKMYRDYYEECFEKYHWDEEISYV